MGWVWFTLPMKPISKAPGHYNGVVRMKTRTCGRYDALSTYLCILYKLQFVHMMWMVITIRIEGFLPKKHKSWTIIGVSCIMYYAFAFFKSFINYFMALSLGGDRNTIVNEFSTLKNNIPARNSQNSHLWQKSNLYFIMSFCIE